MAARGHLKGIEMPDPPFVVGDFDPETGELYGPVGPDGEPIYVYRVNNASVATLIQTDPRATTILSDLTNPINRGTTRVHKSTRRYGGAGVPGSAALNAAGGALNAAAAAAAVPLVVAGAATNAALGAAAGATGLAVDTAAVATGGALGVTAGAVAVATGAATGGIPRMRLSPLDDPDAPVDITTFSDVDKIVDRRREFGRAAEAMQTPGREPEESMVSAESTSTEVPLQDIDA